MRNINSSSKTTQDRPDWANDGFLNFEISVQVPNSEGKNELVWVKLSAAGLKDSVEIQRTVREFCEQSPGNAQKLIEAGRIRVNYRSATPEKKGFKLDLGDLKVA